MCGTDLSSQCASSGACLSRCTDRLCGQTRSGVGNLGEHSLWAEESDGAPLLLDEDSLKD